VTNLQPLLSRDRYTDEEWGLTSAGRCSWNTAFGTPSLTYCRKPSDPRSAYRFCTDHDFDIREDYGADYGK